MKIFQKTLAAVALIGLLAGNSFAATNGLTEPVVKKNGVKAKPAQSTTNVTIANHSTKTAPFFVFTGGTATTTGSGGGPGTTVYYTAATGTNTVVVSNLSTPAGGVRVTVNSVSQTSTGGNLTFTGVTLPILVQLFPN